MSCLKGVQRLYAWLEGVVSISMTPKNHVCFFLYQNKSTENTFNFNNMQILYLIFLSKLTKAHECHDEDRQAPVRTGSLLCWHGQERIARVVNTAGVWTERSGKHLEVKNMFDDNSDTCWASRYGDGPKRMIIEFKVSFLKENVFALGGFKLSTPGVQLAQ